MIGVRDNIITARTQIMVMLNPTRTAKRRRKPVAQRLELPVLMERPSTERRLPGLELVERRGALLRPSPMADIVDEDVLSLNHVSGCPMQCSFCYARGYPGYDGDDRLLLYTNAAELVRRELVQRRHLPRAVYLCPSTDPFPPFNEIQAETLRIVQVLAEFKVQAWLMTRGFLRPRAMDVLAKHRDLVQVTFALTSADEKLRRVLEPLAAPTRLRLKQMRELKGLGITTQATIEPLIQGLTDTRENLVPLLDGLVAAGVNRVSTSYLFVRPGIQQNLERELGPLRLAEPILQGYAQGPILPMGRIAAARHLPRADRQRGYARLMALAAERGITVSVCGLTNPDFTPPRERPIRHERPLRQLELAYARGA
jgi:DNA repair photolyase